MASTCQYISMLPHHSMIDAWSIMFEDEQVISQLPALLDKGSQSHATAIPSVQLGTETKYIIWDTRNVFIQKKVIFNPIYMYLGEQELP